MTRRLVALAVAATLVLGVTGCSLRGGRDDPSTSDPAPTSDSTTSEQAASGDDLDAVLDSLDAVDAALSETESSLSEGEKSASQE
jgi:predicted small lipoprotein YifL